MIRPNNALLLIFTIALFFFTAKPGSAQKTAVSNMSQNVMYLNKENELHIIQESSPCHSLRASTDNGQIRNLGSCRFIYTPERAGMGQIIVRGARGEYNYLVRVEDVKRTVEVYVGYLRPGMIRKSDFSDQLGVIIKLNGHVPDKPYKVLSYSAMILRENKIVRNFVIKGARFSPEARQEFINMHIHDHVLIYNLVAEDPDGQRMILQPAEFIIN